jgi:hypothetical protein
MAKLTEEQAEKLVSEINAIEPRAAKVIYGDRINVEARMQNPRTGTSACWLSCYAPSIPSAEEIVKGMRAELGIRSGRASRAIRSEKAPS